jgi:signal transduction histidine kinase
LVPLFREKGGDELGHSREIVGRRKDRSEIVLEMALTSSAQGGRQHSVVMVHDVTERKRLEKELIDVGERERQQVGHELHDDLGQILHGVQFLVTSLHARLEREGVTEPAQLARVSEYLDEALETTRSLARGLQPVPPVPEGLMNALRDHSVRVSKLYNVRCRFSCAKPVAVTDTKVATHLFRIAQEAVSNAIRHSKCTRIHIGLKLANGNLILGIRDNGHARFPARSRRRGMGLHIMQFRAAAINGSLAVERRPGQGTEVICRVSTTQRGKLDSSPPSQREPTR